MAFIRGIGPSRMTADLPSALRPVTTRRCSRCGMERPFRHRSPRLPGGKTLATKQIGKVKAGNRVLTLAVPGNVARGKASLRFELKDAAGNTFSGKRGIRVVAK